MSVNPDLICNTFLIFLKGIYTSRDVHVLCFLCCLPRPAQKFSEGSFHFQNSLQFSILFFSGTCGAKIAENEDTVRIHW